MTFQKYQDSYLKTASALATPGRDLGRLNEKFASLYAAGALAVEWNFFPWSSDKLRSAILKCEKAHVRLIAQEAHLLASPIERLVVYLKARRNEFLQLDKIWANPNAPGYEQKNDGQTFLILTSSVFDEVVGLREAGYLKRDLVKHGVIPGEYRGSIRATTQIRQKNSTGKKRTVLCHQDQ